MIEFTPDSVRFHRHDLAYPASYPGETIDVNLQFYPIKYSSDGSITIAAVPFVVSQNGNSLLLRGEEVEIELIIKNCCANRMQSRACSSYAEVKPVIDEVN